MAFKGCTVERVILNEGLSSISSQSFSSCKSLISINIPSTLSSVSGFSFAYTSSLNISIKFSQNLSSINPHSFYLSAIKSVDFGECDKITSLPNCLFQSSKIQNIILPPNLVTISESLFQASQIESVEFPPGLKFLGDYCLSSCPKLDRIDISHTQIEEIPDSCFEGSGITSIKLPSCVTSISTRAFASCLKLTAIDFGDNPMLKSIAPSIISKCESLKTFRIPTTVETISDRAFAHAYGLNNFEMISIKNSNQNFIVKDGILYSNEGKILFAFPGGRSNAQIISIVENIRMLSFEGCNKLESITFEQESNIKTLEENTFLDCSNLRAVILPGSLESIDSTTFFGCSSIESVKFSSESKLKSIPSRIFKDCFKMKYFDFHPKIEVIRDSAFENCLIENITFSSISSIGKRAFYNCKELKYIKIKSSIKLIEDTAFDGCQSLKDFSYCGDNLVENILFAGSSLQFVYVGINYNGNNFGTRPTVRLLDNDCLIPTNLFSNPVTTHLYELVSLINLNTSEERG